MAATIEQLLVNNPNWSYVEIGVAYIAWDAAIKYMEAKFTSTNNAMAAISLCNDIASIHLPAQSDFKALVVELMQKAEGIAKQHQ